MIHYESSIMRHSLCYTFSSKLSHFWGHITIPLPFEDDISRLSPTRAFLHIPPITHTPLKSSVLLEFRVVGSAYWQRERCFGIVLVWAKKYLLAETRTKELPGVCLYARIYHRKANCIKNVWFRHNDAKLFGYSAIIERAFAEKMGKSAYS